MLILKSVIRILDRSEVFMCPAYFHSFVDNMNIASTLDAGLKTGMYHAQQSCCSEFILWSLEYLYPAHPHKDFGLYISLKLE